MAVNINLYPGIVDTFMPAFLVDSRICRVYFSISQYNVEADIKNVQVTIVNQKTNSSALSVAKYPSAIMLTQLKRDDERPGEDKYYIDIKASDLQSNEFVVDQYYKVQFRFTGVTAQDISLATPQAINSWLSANLEHFSEWSSVCLIRGISNPTVNIQSFDENVETEWLMSNIELLGNITFADDKETEYLKSYQIKLYNSDNELLTDTGLLYTNRENPNEFKYTFKYFFENESHYYFTFEYETQNLYKDKKSYNFVAKQDTSLPFVISSFNIESDEENGQLKLSIKADSVFNDTLAILRASSKDNFKIWQDVHCVALAQSKLDYQWCDRTIESGILYKYAIQRRDELENKQSVLIRYGDPVATIFEHAYLTKDKKQLNIKFDPNVSSMKHMVTDTKIDTIGSRFPYIIRTGAVDYRTFPIGGLISFHMDEDQIFTNKNEIYGESAELYKDFNIENDISEYNDYTYEREFRKMVSDFLTSDDVKLFRSATEGNILVRLTDINFSPNTVLGRYIWSFSCTANEVDDCSIEKYDEYKIQSIRSGD